MMKKIMFDEIDKEKVEVLKKATYENLIKVAIDFSDGLIIGSENVSEGITSYLKKVKVDSQSIMLRDLKFKNFDRIERIVDCNISTYTTRHG